MDQEKPQLPKGENSTVAGSISQSSPVGKSAMPPPLSPVYGFQGMQSKVGSFGTMSGITDPFLALFMGQQYMQFMQQAVPLQMRGYSSNSSDTSLSTRTYESGGFRKLPREIDAEAVTFPKKKRKKDPKTEREGSGAHNKKWEEHHDDVLIPFLAQQAKKVLKGDKPFKRSAFVAAAMEVNKKFGENFTPDNVVNRMRSLKKMYRNMCKCLDISGAGWDEEQKMITLAPSTYEPWVVENPKLKDYVNKPLKHFEDLKIVFGDDFATGAYRKSVYENFGTAPDSVIDLDQDTQEDETLHSLGSDQPQATNASDKSGYNGSKSDARVSRQKSRKAKSDDSTLMSDLVNNVKDLAVAIRDTGSHWTEKLSKSLYAHRGFDESALDGAFEDLSSNMKRARLFIAKPFNAQERQLRELIGAQGVDANGGNNGGDDDVEIDNDSEDEDEDSDDL